MPEPTDRPGFLTHRPRLRAFGLGLAHAVLFAAAFPPLGWWWLVFLAPVPLLMVAARPGPSPLAAGFWAMLGVMPFWVWSHAWIWHVSAAGVYPLVVYLGLYAWAFVVLGAWAVRVRGVPSGLALIVVWLGLEFFRGRIGWSGYPWYLLGHPVIDAPGLARVASLGGVTLVSLLVLIPGAWWVTRRTSPGWWTAVCAAVFGVWLLAGLALGGRGVGGGPDTPGDPVLVGIVQTNVPQDNRLEWSVEQRLIDWMDMREMTESLAGSEPRPDLIVWPEGLVPGWTLDPEAFAHEIERAIVWRLDPQTPAEAEAVARYGSVVPATQVVEEMLAMQHALGVPMLVGAVAFDNLRIVSGPRGIEYDSDAVFNSAFLIRNGRVADVWYDKVHLTPFGEIMPYISAWPWLEQRLLAIGASGMSFGLTPGRTARSIPLDRTGAGDIELATPICFEATMPQVCRRLVVGAARSGRPVLMVNITNDGWFGTSVRGRLMHEQAARWRCVELGVDMVRVANTGVSGLIDRHGRVVSRTAAREAGTMVVPAAPARPGTVFARTGEWGGWLCLLAAPVLAWLGRRAGRRGHGNSLEPAPADE